jgi:hypothetical protein
VGVRAPLREAAPGEAEAAPEALAEPVGEGEGSNVGVPGAPLSLARRGEREGSGEGVGGAPVALPPPPPPGEGVAQGEAVAGAAVALPSRGALPEGGSETVARGEGVGGAVAVTEALPVPPLPVADGAEEEEGHAEAAPEGEPAPPLAVGAPSLGEGVAEAGGEGDAGALGAGDALPALEGVAAPLVRRHSHEHSAAGNYKKTLPAPESLSYWYICSDYKRFLIHSHQAHQRSPEGAFTRCRGVQNALSGIKSQMRCLSHAVQGQTKYLRSRLR